MNKLFKAYVGADPQCGTVMRSNKQHIEGKLGSYIKMRNYLEYAGTRNDEKTVVKRLLSIKS